VLLHIVEAAFTTDGYRTQLSDLKIINAK